VKALAVLAASLALASPGQFVQAHQRADGSFAEPGGPPGVALTAWAVLGLTAAGLPVAEETRGYLLAHEGELRTATDLELALMAELALGLPTDALVARLRALVRPSGAIGPAVNSTVWGVLALRAAGLSAPPEAVRYLLARQARSGGWGWGDGLAPDSNDTAAAIQALRSAGVTGTPIRRGLAYLRRLQNRDGGFALSPGRDSDAQSTAWAIQAFVAAGVRPHPRAFRFLERLRRSDGSYRYSQRYTTTPVWVTSQVLPALARKPFPLR
jgi:hypothetical protein